jgi:beta-lactamase regulating signal transducer with metallopeptidase domain
VNSPELMNAAALAVSSALNSLWLGLLITGLTALIVRLLPRSNATTRYAVWLTALALIVALPIGLPLMPKEAVAVSAVSTHVAALPQLEVPAAATWPLYVGLGWLAITALLLARVVWSLCHIASLKRHSKVIGTRGNIRLLASSEVRVPMAVGFLRRAIIFPQAVLDELSAVEFEQVLSHELAHLRRWDDWTQLLDAVAQAVLFFNPALYWIGRHLKIEREIACDDWVVSATGQARPYAACITHLHELTRRAAAPQLAAGVTGKTRWQISARVEALLAPGRNATPHFSRSGWVAGCALVSAGLMVAIQTPAPVGVQEAPQAPVQTAYSNAPAAPAIARVPVVLASMTSAPMKTQTVRAVRPRPARRIAKLTTRVARQNFEEQQAQQAPFILVGTWQVEAPPHCLVIAVIFFEPPPPIALHRI